MENIYSNPRAVIYKMMAILEANHNFPHSEVQWRVTKVIPIDRLKDLSDSEVVFIVSTSVKELLVRQHDIYAKEEQLEPMPTKSSSAWELSIKASGIESYYFARLLFMGVMKLAKKQRTQEALDNKLINMYLSDVRAKTMGLPKKIKINKEGGIYFLSSSGPKNHLLTPLYDIDNLCLHIGRNFKGYVET